MKGFIRRLAKGIALAAVAGSLGCQALQSSCGTGSCGNKFAGGGKGPPFEQLKDDLRNFDYEQLHPDHCWPEQYTREARRRVNAPLGAQVEQGNKIELTMWSHYFENVPEHEAELNDAGKVRLQYLARRKPYVMPGLYLTTSFDKQLDQKRIQAIVAYANQVSMEPTPWHVTVINSKANGLFGPEGPTSISKMLKRTQNVPQYEQQIKQNFMAGNSGGGGGGGN